MVLRKSQSDHDRMVKHVAEFLVSKHYRDVKADLPGWPTPEKIVWTSTNEGHIPDVTAMGQLFNLFEVETDDTINIDHTADQWKLFSRYAEQHNAVFWVVVPGGSKLKAEQRIKQLGIKADVWEVAVPAYA